MEKQILPISIQGFKELRDENYLYIDKTEYVHKLVTTNKAYFLSRPRRFGKSLLISTLKELFLGSKELFNNLWICKNTNYDFTKYPVIHIDTTNLSRKNSKSLNDTANMLLKEYCIEYNLDIEFYDQADINFRTLLVALKNKYQVSPVVLIDEYDKPILDNIGKLEIAQEVREFLKNFYGVLKGAELRFLFLTGVTKFSQTSLFSGLNHLLDITLDKTYASMLGYTQDELESNFKQYILTAQEANKLTKNELLEKIRFWYNGYKFHHDAISVYNPFSIVKFFQASEFKNFWFTSGTPTFLITILKRSENLKIDNLDHIIISDNYINKFDIDKIELSVLLFQTGYLTIDSYDSEDFVYKLRFPNFEVENSLYEEIVKGFSNLNIEDVTLDLINLKNYLKNGQIPEYIETLQRFFSAIPYDIQLNYEKYYQSIFYAVNRVVSLKTNAEFRTNKGRVDLIITINNNIYIIEFKVNKSADIALKQIEDNKYYEQYLNNQKNIYLIGINFQIEDDGKKIRNIVDYKFKKI